MSLRSRPLCVTNPIPSDTTVAATIIRPNPRTVVREAKYKAPTKAFNLQLRFTKSRVDRDEVIDALQAIIKELKSQ